MIANPAAFARPGAHRRNAGRNVHVDERSAPLIFLYYEHMSEELLLSPRDKKLLRRLAKGMTDHAIAVEIGGRADQVHDQRLRLLAKLQIIAQRDLVAAAERLAPWPADNGGGHGRRGPA